MLRYQVIEAFADGDRVRIQPLNLHPTLTSAYWYYAPSMKQELASIRLQAIDLKRQVIFNWLQVEKLMMFECLKRLSNHKGIDFRHAQFLLGLGYIDVNQSLTTKGFELIAEIERPTLAVQLGHIKSTGKMLLGG